MENSREYLEIFSIPFLSYAFIILASRLIFPTVQLYLKDGLKNEGIPYPSELKFMMFSNSYSDDDTLRNKISIVCSPH